MPVTQNDVTEAILASASENSALLVKLESTEEAPGNLALHLHTISRLQKDIKEQDDELKSLKEDVEGKLRTHKKFSNRSSRKLLYRASFMLPKFEEKAMRGEQEYFSVLAILSKVQERRAAMQRALEKAEDEERKLYAAAKEHGDTHEKIDELYENLFAGPTPGYVREDSLENRFYIARSKHESVKATIITARQAMRLLKSAQFNLKRSQGLLDLAYEETSNSLLFFDSSFYSIDGSNREIDIALAAVSRCSEFLEPHTKNFEKVARVTMKVLGEAKIGPGVRSNRDAIFLAIKNAQEPCIKGKAHLQDYIALATKHRDDSLDELKKTARKLEDARQALLHTRMGIFEEVAGFGRAAPSYTECCDRAAASCEIPSIPSEEDGELLSVFPPEYTVHESHSDIAVDELVGPMSASHRGDFGVYDRRTAVSPPIRNLGTEFPVEERTRDRVLPGEGNVAPVSALVEGQAPTLPMPVDRRDEWSKHLNENARAETYGKNSYVAASTKPARRTST